MFPECKPHISSSEDTSHPRPPQLSIEMCRKFENQSWIMYHERVARLQEEERAILWVSSSDFPQNQIESDRIYIWRLPGKILPPEIESWECSSSHSSFILQDTIIVELNWIFHIPSISCFKYWVRIHFSFLFFSFTRKREKMLLSPVKNQENLSI